MNAYLAGSVLGLGLLGITAVEMNAKENIDPRDNTEVGKKIHKVLDEMNKNQDKNLSFPKGNGVRVIMLGNSWTFPAVQTLPEIARAAGFSDHRTRSCTPGSDRGHPDPLFKNPTAQHTIWPAIATGQWDALTLLSRWGDKPEFFAQWIYLGLKANPEMKFYIQTGWPYADKNSLKNQEDSQSVIAQIETALAQQKAEHQNNYDALQAKYPGKVFMIPCGDAVLEMVRLYYAGKLSGFDCLSQVSGGKKGIYLDGSHLSPDLHYLLGYLFYATIYRSSPEAIKDFSPKGIDPELDRIMRRVAWQAVINCPASGVATKDNALPQPTTRSPPARVGLNGR